MVTPSPSRPRPVAARQWDGLVAVLRVAMGMVFVVAGLKLTVPTLFDLAGGDALVGAFVDPTDGYLAPWLVDTITDDLHLSVRSFLFVQGVVEVTMGLLLVAGVATRMVAVNLAVMLWLFTVAAPVAGTIRLARDLALLAVCVALARAGGGRWSLDHRIGGASAGSAERRDASLVLIRLGLAFPMLTSVVFTGGVFDNPLNTTLPRPIVATFGLLLVAGVLPRVATALTALCLGAAVIESVVGAGVFVGLDGAKREMALAAAGFVYAVAGPDHWSWWPQPARMRCQEVVELLLDYVDGTLAPDRRRALELHAGDCRDCGAHVAAYQQIVTLGRQLGGTTMPVEMRQKLAELDLPS